MAASIMTVRTFRDANGVNRETATEQGPRDPARAGGAIPWRTPSLSLND
jgi:hypothetical protein